MKVFYEYRYIPIKNDGGYMNTDSNQFGNKRLAKLATENTGLNKCCADMSDVSFEIGKSSNSVKIFIHFA